MIKQSNNSDPDPFRLKRQIERARLQAAARLFAALSDVSRLVLVQRLIERPCRVSELVDATGLSQANVSKHLGVLRAVHLVERERVGPAAVYRVVGSVCQELCDAVCGKLQADARLLGGEVVGVNPTDREPPDRSSARTRTKRR